MDKFYIEYDEVDKTWNIFEVDGASAEGVWFDNLLCSCFYEEEADKVKFALERVYGEDDNWSKEVVRLLSGL